MNTKRKLLIKKTYTCPHCGQHFEFEPNRKVAGFISVHVRTCEKNPKHEYYIKQLKEFREIGTKCQALKRHAKTEASKKEYVFTCENPKCNSWESYGTRSGNTPARF